MLENKIQQRKNTVYSKVWGEGKHSAQVCSMCANPWCSCGKEPQSGRRDARKETILRNVRYGASLYFGAAVNSCGFRKRASSYEPTNEWASEPNGRCILRALDRYANRYGAKDTLEGQYSKWHIVGAGPRWERGERDRDSKARKRK